MGYVLRAKERIDAGLRRVVREQIHGALEDLDPANPDRHEGVHEARKRFKMIRAVLRLARGSLGESLFVVENTWYRDTGRRLSSVRDAVAMIECFDALRRRFERDIDEATAAKVRATLQERLQGVAAAEEGLDGRAAEVAGGLRNGLIRVRAWPIPDQGFETIGPGLERVYRQGRLAMETALPDPRDENLHEWRKRVKDHWYHVRLLRNVWPKVMDAYKKEMKALSDTLGNDHDLAVLAPALRSDPAAFGGEETVIRLQERIVKRRAELQAQARTHGRRIYAEKPRTLVARFEARW